MKSLSFILLLFIQVGLSYNKEIKAKVTFENTTQKEFTKGKLLILELNKTIEISSLEAIHVELPKKRKYRFVFASDDFIGVVSHTKRITEKNNLVEVKLYDKKEVKYTYNRKLNKNSNLTDAEMKQLIEEGNVNFIYHGINGANTENILAFKEKYGVGFVVENCVIDPLSFEKAVENNLKIKEYLDRKVKEDWLSELVQLPFGIKK